MSTVSISELGVTFFKGISVKEKGAEGEYVLVPSGAVFPGHIKFERCKRFKGDAAKLSQKFLQPNDVLFNSGGVGTLGRSHHIEDIQPETYVPDSFVLVLRSSGEQLLSKYLYYYLQSPIAKQLIEENTRGTIGITSIKSEAVLGFPIPCPALPDQQRIVRLLDEVFEGIGIAKANAEKNLESARALFENQLEIAFTQLGATVKEVNLSAVCDITSKLVDPRDEQYQALIHVGAGNIRSKTGEFVDLLNAREEALISGKFLFDETMVLYSKIRPYLMKVGRPNFDGLCSADIYPLSPHEKVMTRGFLYYLLLTKGFTEYAVNGSARAGMPKVNRDHLFQFTFALPAIEKQVVIVAKLDALRVETQRLSDLFQQKCTALEHLKQAMLMQAISGELKAA